MDIGVVVLLLVAPVAVAIPLAVVLVALFCINPDFVAAAPVPVDEDELVTSNEFPAKTANPALLTTFVALKFPLVAPALVSDWRAVLFPTCRSSWV